MLLLWSLPRMLGGQVMLLMLAKSANARLKLKPFSKKISTTSVLSVSSCPLRRKACRGKAPDLEVPLRGFALPGPAMQTASLSQSGKDLTCQCGREHWQIAQSSLALSGWILVLLWPDLWVTNFSWTLQLKSKQLQPTIHGSGQDTKHLPKMWCAVWKLTCVTPICNKHPCVCCLGPMWIWLMHIPLPLVSAQQWHKQGMNTSTRWQPQWVTHTMGTTELLHVFGLWSGVAKNQQCSLITHHGSTMWLMREGLCITQHTTRSSPWTVEKVCCNRWYCKSNWFITRVCSRIAAAGAEVPAANCKGSHNQHLMFPLWVSAQLMHLFDTNWEVFGLRSQKWNKKRSTNSSWKKGRTGKWPGRPGSKGGTEPKTKDRLLTGAKDSYWRTPH